MDVSDLCMSSDEGSPASDVIMNEYVALISFVNNTTTTRLNLVSSGGCQQGQSKCVFIFQARLNASFSFISLSYNVNGLLTLQFIDNHLNNDFHPFITLLVNHLGQQQWNTNQSTIAAAVVVVPATPPWHVMQPLSDTSPTLNLTQAINTCTSLCQDIEVMRRDCQYSVILEQIATKANTLLHALKQDDVKPEYAMIRRARNLQDGARGSYRRRTKKTTVGQRCHSCHTTETPEWRRGPDGARTLCNACGLHYSKLMRKGSLTVQHQNEIESVSSSPRVIQYPNHMGGRMGVCIGQQHDAFINYIADTPQ